MFETTMSWRSWLADNPSRSPPYTVRAGDAALDRARLGERHPIISRPSRARGFPRDARVGRSADAGTWRSERVRVARPRPDRRPRAAGLGSRPPSAGASRRCRDRRGGPAGRAGRRARASARTGRRVGGKRRVGEQREVDVALGPHRAPLAGEQAPDRQPRPSRREVPEREVEARGDPGRRARLARPEGQRVQAPLESREGRGRAGEAPAEREGAATVSTSRARYSAPRAGTLHQISPRPKAPSPSSTRTRGQGRLVIVPKEVRTGRSVGARRSRTARRAGRRGTETTVSPCPGMPVPPLPPVPSCALPAPGRFR